MGPWINYPIEENDYPPEFFSEFTGVNLKSLSALSNTIPSDRSSGFGHPIRDSPNVEHRHASKSLAGDSEASRIRTGELFPLSQQWQSLVPSRNHQVPCGNSQADSVQKQGAGSCKPAQQSSSVGLRNFPHFSRPVALVISNLQSVDESRSNVKASTAASSNPMGSTVINSASGLKGISVIKGQSAPVPPRPPREGASGEQLEAVFEKDTCRNKKIHNITGSSTRSPDHIHHQSSNTVAFARRETEKGPEAVVASSSVCSANSAGAELNDPTQATKRKDQEGEESGYQSEDLENESEGLKKVANGRGMSTKRSRAAEVHNLSERRRRDRINEKMRALQELIPNCNRVDKASMLDEAIEYLKTLQLQVQIMSMGSGLCMHPMMLPAGMQHRLPPPMAHFSPMSVNMGLGYGMGMNGSSGFPMMPVRPMHGPQFHYASMPVHGMPGSTGLQMFGIPGQGIPVSMPNTPPFGPLSGFTARVNMVPDIRGATTSPLPVADTAPSSNSKDQEQHNIS